MNLHEQQESNKRCADAVVESNRELLLQRSQKGVTTYGVTLADAKHPAPVLIQHAIEEALDLANYLQALLRGGALPATAPGLSVAHAELSDRFSALAAESVADGLAIVELRATNAQLRERAERAEASFKNFHRSLCDRFGYTHDETDWARDQVSLEEHIAALVQRAVPAPTAVVYPEDGTVSPFTVINLGAGKVRMGDSIHDGRLPALWFGKDGTGIGNEEVLNRAAKDGETLAVVTFANVAGLDVLMEVVERIRREKFPAAAVATDGQAHDEEAAIRLRAICDRLGIGSHVPQDNATLWGAAFAVLGQIRTTLDRQAAQPTVDEHDNDYVCRLIEQTVDAGGFDVDTPAGVDAALHAVARASIAAMQPAQADDATLIRKLVTGDVGRATLQKIADGQGTETEDGKAWLAAQAAIAAQKGGA